MTDPVAALVMVIESKKAVITPSEAAKVLQCAPYALNRKAKEGTLPFKGFFIGDRLLIPRIPFLEYLGYTKEKGDNSNDV